MIKKILIFLFLFINFLFAGQHPEKAKDPLQEINNEHFDMEINKLKKGENTQTIINKTTGKAIDIETDSHGKNKKLNVQEQLDYLEDNKVDNFGDTMTDYLHFSSTAIISGKDDANKIWTMDLLSKNTYQAIIELHYSSNTLASTTENGITIDTTTMNANGTFSETQIYPNYLRLNKTNTTTLITDFKQNYTDGIVTGQLDSFSTLGAVPDTTYETGGMWYIQKDPANYTGIIKQLTNTNNEYRKINFQGHTNDYTLNYSRFIISNGGCGSPYPSSDSNLPANYSFYGYRYGNNWIYNLNSSSSIFSTIGETTIIQIEIQPNLSTVIKDAFIGGNTIYAFTWQYNYIGIIGFTQYANYPTITNWDEYSAGYKSTGTLNYVYDSGYAGTDWNTFVISDSGTYTVGQTDYHLRFRTSTDNINWTSWSSSFDVESDDNYDLSSLTNGRYLEIEFTLHSPTCLNTPIIYNFYANYTYSSGANTVYTQRSIFEDTQLTGNIKGDGYKLYISSIQFSDYTILNSTKNLGRNYDTEINNILLATTTLRTDLTTLQTNVASSTNTLQTQINNLGVSTGTINSNFSNYGALAGTQTWTGTNTFSNTIAGTIQNSDKLDNYHWTDIHTEWIDKIAIGDNGEVLVSDEGKILINE